MFTTIAELLAYRARIQPERSALICEGTRVGYGELYNAARRAAAELQNLGLQAGDRFAILALNRRSVIDLILGGALSGIVPVLLNWRLGAEEVAYITRDAGCRHLFFGNDLRDPGWTLPARLIELPEQGAFVAESESAVPASRSAAPGNADIFLQLYTSGTTGLPRGVPTSHANMLALTEQLRLEVPAFGPESMNLVCAPFFHIAGVGYLLFGLHAGATNVVLPRFAPDAVIAAVRDHRVSHALLVPAMQQAVLDAEPDAADFASLRHLLYGASPISRPLLERAAQTFRCDFTQAYGLTETTGVATLLGCEDHRRALAGASETARERIASAGKAAAGIELEIRDEQGRPLGSGAEGEVFIRGATVMGGYWQDSERNARALRDGWLASGDIGRLDEAGYLFLLDRKNDLIVSKGEKIYPIEVERFYIQHPDVDDLAVAGIPDEEFGEGACAFVVSKREITLAELRAWRPEGLAGYKRPRRVVRVEELPRNPSGKVLRRELRRPFWEGRERNIS